MCDHIKPSLRKRPDQLKIHVGTNSLKDSVSQTARTEEIMDLAKSIKKSAPEIDVVISRPLARSDILL